MFFRGGGGNKYECFPSGGVRLVEFGPLLLPEGVGLVPPHVEGGRVHDRRLDDLTTWKYKIVLTGRIENLWMQYCVQQASIQEDETNDHDFIVHLFKGCIRL